METIMKNDINARQPWDLTDEEMAHNNYHIPLLSKAIEENDKKAEEFHLAQIYNNPDALMAAKIISGAQ